MKHAGLIESWFAAQDDGEFVVADSDRAFVVHPASKPAARTLYTTKPRVFSAMAHRAAGLDRWGMIGRYGLPTASDVPIIDQAGGGAGLWFLGDLDPPDLLVFAWLRDRLPAGRIAWLGLNDDWLSGLKPSVPEALAIPLSPSEVDAMRLVESLIPDMEQLVGARCSGLLARGRKLELEVLLHAPEAAGAFLRSIGESL